MYIGIDYSMSCPCFCELDEAGSFRFSFFTKIIKYGIYTPHFTGHFLDKKIVGINRFDIIAHRFAQEISILKPKNVCLEGYSYGSKGQVFEIGENTGILKLELFRNFIEPTIIAPPTLKKFATGSGRASKEEMYDAFLEETKLDLENQYDLKIGKSPSSDMVDSYFLAKRASKL
jgi:hypothetical protein